MEEAAGLPVSDAQPFRAAPNGRRRRHLRRGFGYAAVAVLVVAVTVFAWQAGWGERIRTASNPAAAAGPRSAPPAGVEEASTPLGTPPTAPTGPGAASYRFTATQPDGTTPVTFSPCRPIHYVVRAAHAPKDGAAMITAAVAAVAKATGLRFAYDGTTEETPAGDRKAYQPDRYGDRWAPVLIAWATPDEVPDFGVDVAGEAGPVRVTRADGTSVYVGGQVTLDPAKIARIQQQQGTPVAEAILLHELGHLVGLAHVNDPTQVLYPRGSTTVTAYAAGDLAGLARLGRGACAPDV